MSTRATISIKVTSKGNPAVRSLYQHWDGYPTGLGVTLRDHYKTPGKVRELMKMGSASSVKSTVALSEFYHRDRGESKKSTRALTAANMQEAAGFFAWCEWHYLFDPKTGTWECAPSKGYEENTLEAPFRPLEEVIAKEAARLAAYYAKRKAEAELAKA